MPYLLRRSGAPDVGARRPMRAADWGEEGSDRG